MPGDLEHVWSVVDVAREVGRACQPFIELRKGEKISNWNVWEMLSVEELFELDL